MTIKKKILIAGLASIALMVVFINIPETKQQITTPHFKFLFSKSIDTITIRTLANVLEDNYWRISNHLQTLPAENIEVNIYARRWRYIRATKHFAASGNIEGISKIHFVEQAWGESDNKKIALHEFTHAVVLKFLLDRAPQPINAQNFDNKFADFPVWLWEALSVYEAGQFIHPSTLTYFENGLYPSIATLNSRAMGGKIYQCGYTMIEYILAVFGRDLLLRLTENYGNLQQVLQMTDEQFCKGWYDFIEKKYLQNQAAQNQTKREK